MALRDIRILVAIDFGTTYSGFAYVHTDNQNNVETNNTWPGREGVFKTPTALLYNETYTEVKSWGDLALEEEPEYVTDDIEEIRHRPVELFKLHISDLKDSQKPWLPLQLDYKKAIEDYLTQMKVLIKDTLEKRWPTIRFPQQIGFVLTIPAEWPHNTTRIMRECAYKAGLLTTLNSSHLEFTTEPEAAALYCLNVVKEHNLRPGDTFLVADCGGGTVDITSRKLRQDNKLSEITERIGELCGSTFVDKEFLHWLGRKVGFQALEKLKRLNYGQMQHLIQQFFCHLVKFKFKNDTNFRPIRLILHKYCPDLQQYVTGEHKEQMEDAGWIVRLDYESVKEMFDPVINKILKLIEGQLIQAKERCSAIFLVGGFSESPYLLSRVRETFIDQVPIIAVPALPIAAVVRGAITYGLNVEVVQERVLKWTYGIEVCRSWVAGKDKKIRKTSDGLIFYFYKLAQRRTRVDVDKKFSGEFVPVRANQTNIVFNIYYTARDSAKFCDEPGMKLLGTLRINTPDTHLGLNRPVEFSLTFAKMEIKATAINKRNGKIYDETTFELDI